MSAPLITGANLLVCVCVYFSSFCLSPFKVGNIFTTHTHTRAAVTKGRLCIYELLFFFFLSLSPVFVFFKRDSLGRPREYSKRVRGRRPGKKNIYIINE